jgi:hypothetical protein
MNLDIPIKNRLNSQETSAPSMYDITIDTIDGEAIDFSSFKGKKNTFCERCLQVRLHKAV